MHRKAFIIKMFILNAVRHGWKVDRITKNRYVFTKDIRHAPNYFSPMFLKKFITDNLIK